MAFMAHLAGRSRLGAAAAAASLIGAALPLSGLVAGPAVATTDPDCTVSSGTVTCVFSYNGSDNTDGTAIDWTVPAGVTSLTVLAEGAEGANGYQGSTREGDGGKGGMYRATLTGSSLAGTELTIFPGGKGSTKAGGVNQSGRGGNSTKATGATANGGGGGATTIAISPFSVGNLLVVAGGGGGGAGGGDYNGGHGGTSKDTSGQDGNGLTAGSAGMGATSSTFGAGGAAAGMCDAGGDGAQLQGGDGPPGGSGCSGGAGGGSGLFGGGGSSGDSQAGGGGSAFPANVFALSGITVTPKPTSGLHSGDGKVEISYAQLGTQLTKVVAEKVGGGTLQASATLTTSSGVDVPGETVSFSANGTPLCSATTNSDGVASCVDPGASSVLNSLDKIVTATFAGDGSYQPSTGLGQIIRYE